MTTTRTIEAQTGYKRIAPRALHSFEALKLVTEYSFDTTNRAFLRYFEERTGCFIGVNPKNTQVLERIKNGFTDSIPALFLKNPAAFLKHNIDLANLSDDEYQARYRGNVLQNRIYKAKLQDCWELFTNEKPALQKTTLQPPHQDLLSLVGWNN